MNAGQAHRSGFAALVGRPNVGKSTLLNSLVGRKLAIMSDKPQTTRNRILGVLHRPDAQVVFLDTPGIHKPHHRLGHYLNRIAQRAIPEVDVVLFVVDGTGPPGDGDRFVAQEIARAGKPAILVVNKLDRIPREQLYSTLGAYTALGRFIDAIPVSAVAQTHLDDLVRVIVAQLPEGPRYYPEDMVTDQPEKFIMAERIREKVLHLTREEVPHSVAVEIEELQRRDNGVVYVRAVIVVERESQKGILIGARGSMIREIGRLAREDLEGVLGSRIFLELFVKVVEDWRNRDRTLRELGYTP